MTGVVEMGEDVGRIGRYGTRRVLGSGAFATVWLASDDELDVPVAIKVLADNWAHNSEVQARFVEEARILRRISDARVIGVHDIGSLTDGRSYFVMDYADGGTLTDRVPGLDRGTALAYAVEVAQAVQVLHDHGVLHRDVKPSNVLIRRRPGRADQLMVADLGTAKALAEASGLTLSAGTPAYMAPEQAHGRWGLDERADVYGAAAVAYTLLAGRAPFLGERELSDVAFRDPRQRPAPLDDGGPLDQLLGSALAFDPDDRPASAHDLADRLLRIAVDDVSHPRSGTWSASWSDQPQARDQPTQRIPAVGSAAAERIRTPITPPTRVTLSGDGETAAPRPDRELVPPEREPLHRPSNGPGPSAAARPGISTAGLVALAVVVFVIAAVGTWLLLGQL